MTKRSLTGCYSSGDITSSTIVIETVRSFTRNVLYHATEFSCIVAFSLNISIYLHGMMKCFIRPDGLEIGTIVRDKTTLGIVNDYKYNLLSLAELEVLKKARGFKNLPAIIPSSPNSIP